LKSLKVAPYILVNADMPYFLGIFLKED